MYLCLCISFHGYRSRRDEITPSKPRTTHKDETIKVSTIARNMPAVALLLLPKLRSRKVVESTLIVSLPLARCRWISGA